MTKPKANRPGKTVSRLRRVGSVLRKLTPKAAPPGVVLTNVKERRKARRQSTGLQLTMADHIDGLNPVLWDALAEKETVFLSRAYLRTLEEHTPVNMSLRYVLATDAGRPVAIMLFQRLAVDGGRLRKPGGKSLLAKPMSGYKEHMLVCGNLLVWGPRAVAFASDCEDEAQLWRAVGEALYRVRRADRLLGQSDFAMIKDFPGDNTTAPQALRLLGYRSVETEPDMVLAISPQWKSFDDYLASLTSGYRSNCKKLTKSCAEAGVVFRTMGADEMTTRQDELHALYNQVHQAQGLRLASLVPGYLPAMAKALGPEHFVCRVAERNGQLLGFVTTVKDGDTAVGYYIGYDRTSNADAPLYLSLLQSTIEDAIGFGAAQLSLGRTALEPKAKMGCKPVPLACGIRHRVSALNWVISALTKTAVHDEPPERSPFKGDKQLKDGGKAAQPTPAKDKG
ncbi:GNAT family N-acetyltransferase [Hydrogenophaga sp. 5NK40-0174]|uniref:GNAT family N-acetyltransferase n=1 Tax=Hydrogenophaga sp. 5NK40-0174 TaxID=3127649 RepID=UPI0031049B0E